MHEFGDQLQAQTCYWRVRFLRHAATPQAVRTVNLMRFNGTNWRLQSPNREASEVLSVVCNSEIRSVITAGKINLTAKKILGLPNSGEDSGES
jgi:hypothetical protein